MLSHAEYRFPTGVCRIALPLPGRGKNVPVSCSANSSWNKRLQPMGMSEQTQQLQWFDQCDSFVAGIQRSACHLFLQADIIQLTGNLRTYSNHTWIESWVANAGRAYAEAQGNGRLVWALAKASPTMWRIPENCQRKI